MNRVKAVSTLAVALLSVAQAAKAGPSISIEVPAPRTPSTAPISRLGASGWVTLQTPRTDQLKPLSLWATYYHVYGANPTAEGYPLLNPAGKPLGPVLSRRDWCYAALQGTVQVTNNLGTPITYNFAGRGSRSQVDCSPFFSSLSRATIQKVNRVRFQPATAAFGYGTDGFKLVPYRTIAVDRSRIPIGSVLFIPEARGQQVVLPSGETVVHDGYFFAGDVGSAVKGNHVDVFVGTAKRVPFSFVTSRSSGTFRAYLVNDAAIVQTLRSLHSR